MRRLAILVICACALPVTGARAWTWPVDGPVLRPFAFDRAHPYAGGQHRGVDLGAPSGSPVLAPAEGIVSFAGTVPTGGKTVSIETPFGYTETLVHLGSIAVVRGALVGEGSVVGTVGPSGVVDLADPYVYFGARTTSDPQGYVDPLALLPPHVAPRPSPATGPVVSGSNAGSVETAVPALSTGATPALEAAPSSASEAVKLATASSTPAATSAAATAPVTQTVAPVATHPATIVTAAGGADAPGEAGAVEAPHVVPAATEPSAPATAARHNRVSHAKAGSSSPESVVANIGKMLGSSGSNKVGLRTPAGATPARQEEVASPFGLLDDSRVVLLVALTLAGGIAVAFRRSSKAKTARIMVLPRPEHVLGRRETEAEDLGGPSLAVRSREEASRPRGRVCSAGGHLRAVSEAEGQRRPDGERDGRARYAGDGHGGPRKRLAA